MEVGYYYMVNVKRSLIEVFKYINIVTWYSVIRVNKLWLSAGTCDEIVRKILDHPTYEVYLMTKNRKYHYYYTKKYGMEAMIQRSIKNPEERLKLPKDHNDDKPVGYYKYILVGITILIIIGYCLIN